MTSTEAAPETMPTAQVNTVLPEVSSDGITKAYLRTTTCSLQTLSEVQRIWPDRLPESQVWTPTGNLTMWKALKAMKTITGSIVMVIPHMRSCLVNRARNFSTTTKHLMHGRMYIQSGIWRKTKLWSLPIWKTLWWAAAQGKYLSMFIRRTARWLFWWTIRQAARQNRVAMRKRRMFKTRVRILLNFVWKRFGKGTRKKIVRMRSSLTLQEAMKKTENRL